MNMQKTRTGQPEPAVLGATPGRADAWLTAARFASLLALLIFIAFPQVVLGLETFVFRDFGRFGYPLAYFQRACFWHGRLPFWNPYNNCGVPFFAQWNTMSLYPGALIYLLLPLGWSLSFFCLLHLFFGGIGMYELARRWTDDRLGASVAGLVFAFNGLSLNSLMWPSQIATFAWMPWVVLAAERGWQEGGKRVLWAGLAGALQMLCGGPETILFTWILVGGLWVVSSKSQVQGPRSKADKRQFRLHVPQLGVATAKFQDQGGAWLRTGLRLGAIVLIVFGLSAAQVLPFLDLVRHSQRGHHFADLRWPLPSRGWANFLVPMALGSAGEGGVWFEHGQYWTSSFYLGTGTMLLALLAIRRVRERRVWFLALASLGAFVLALGDQTIVYRWLREVFPPLSGMTFPVKFVILIIFIWPLLAGIGLAHLRLQYGQQAQAGEDLAEGPGAPSAVLLQDPAEALRAPNGQRRSVPRRMAEPAKAGTSNLRSIDRQVLLMAAGLILLILAIVMWAWISPLPLDDFAATLRNGISRAVFLGLITAVILLFRLSTSGHRQAFFALALLIVMWLDLWTHEPQQNPTAPPSIYQPNLVRAELAMNPQPGFGQTRVMVSPWANDLFEQQHAKVKDVKDSYLAARLGYYGDCNLLDAVPKVDGFFALYPYYSDQMKQLLYLATNTSYPRLADFLCVSQTTAPGEATVWERRSTFLPPIIAGQRPVFLDDTNILRHMIRSDFDATSTVYLPQESQALVSVTNHAEVHLLSQRFTLEEVEAEVEASAPSVVTFSQSYYHSWRASVDNRAVPLLRANFAFQGVEVPTGKHHIRLTYRERGFRIGGIISILTALACIGWVSLERLEKWRPG